VRLRAVLLTQILAASTVGDGADLGDGGITHAVQLLPATTDEKLVAMKLLVAGGWRRSGS
jgi:hypothetical protein